MTTNTDTAKFLQELLPDHAKHGLFASEHNGVKDSWQEFRKAESLDGTRDCYLSTGVLPDDGIAKRKGRVQSVWALVIDDIGTTGPSETAVVKVLGEPTAEVLTSKGNAQWWYALSRRIPFADWRTFFEEIKRLIGVKHLDGGEAGHVFRIPMGLNTKTERKGKPVPLDEQNFAVRLGRTTWSRRLDVDAILLFAEPVSGPGPSAVSGTGSDIKLSLDELREFMSWIPVSLFPDRNNSWMDALHDIKALCADDEDGFTVADEWSEPEKYPGYNRLTWKDLGASGLKSTGGMLKGLAQKLNPDGYNRMFAPKAFPDDGAAKPSGPSGVDFFIDQERSSIEVVKHFAGRLKKVGRDDWREFSEDTGRWREWTGDHMFRRVLELVNERKRRVLDPEVSKKLGSVKFIEGIARAAGLHASMAAKPTDFDRAPLLLGVPSGVIDLKKGASRAIRPGRASEMVSKAMWVDPAPSGTPHPVWSKFLAEFTRGDASLEEWLQVRAGYCLTGLMDEYIMPFYHGSGGNGKSVYLNALRSVWGEYGTQMEHRLLFEKQGGYHLAPLAVLAGVRLAIVTDVPQGASWDVHIMKMLTGDDAITANRMHQNPITFKSTAKVDVSGNGEPTVRNMDEGVRRRLKLIPLTAVPKTIDKQLSRKLVAEWPAILSWALVGLDMYWGLGGFPASKVVDDATGEYHATLDPFQRWADEVLVQDGTPGAKPLFGADLYRSWDAFKSAERAHNTDPLSSRALIKKLKEKDFKFGVLDGYPVLKGYKLAKIDADNVF